MMPQLRTALALLFLTGSLAFGQNNGLPVPKIKSGKPGTYNILFDGNSWLAGSGSDSGKNLPNQLKALLEKAGNTVTITNYAIPGQTIDQMQANAAKKIDPNHSKFQYLIGLELVNQWGQHDNESREAVYAKYKKYFLDRKAAGFQHVIALTPIPQGYYPRPKWVEDRKWFAAKMLEEFPKLSIEVADCGSDPHLDWKDATYYSKDKIHPNNAGYGIMTSVIFKALTSGD